MKHRHCIDYFFLIPKVRTCEGMILSYLFDNNVILHMSDRFRDSMNSPGRRRGELHP